MAQTTTTPDAPDITQALHDSLGTLTTGALGHAVMIMFTVSAVIFGISIFWRVLKSVMMFDTPYSPSEKVVEEKPKPAVLAKPELKLSDWEKWEKEVNATGEATLKNIQKLHKELTASSDLTADDNYELTQIRKTHLPTTMSLYLQNKQMVGDSNTDKLNEALEEQLRIVETKLTNMKNTIIARLNDDMTIQQKFLEDKYCPEEMTVPASTEKKYESEPVPVTLKKGHQVDVTNLKFVAADPKPHTPGERPQVDHLFSKIRS